MSTKLYKNGMVLGKMFPVTMGHKYLIDTCISNCENTYVFICSRSFEVPNGQDRYDALKEIYQNNTSVHIIHIDDDTLPQEPQEHEDFWKIWHDVVYNRVNFIFDALFTSENYGEPYANVLNCEHVMVDQERITFPISGTKMRADFYHNWNMLPHAMQKRMVKKVAIIGPESVGKTTITGIMAGHFKCDEMFEYGREYTYTCDMSNFSLNDIINIYEGHKERYNKILELCKSPIIFFDTDVLETASWSLLYFNEIPKIVSDNLNNKDIDLYLLLTPEVEWINDGTREFPHRRKEHFNIIKDLVSKSGVKYYIIDGDKYVDRVEKCMSIISEEYNIDL